METYEKQTFYKSSIQIIPYSDAQFLLLTGQENSGQIVHYSDHHSKNGPFDYRTNFDHSKTSLVRYSDPPVSE